MTFIHTADWHVGKPFAGVADQAKRARLQAERIEVVRRIGQAVREHAAACVLVAGDLFDGPTPDRRTVSALCSAVGSLGVPVYAIPGNHDHGGPGSIWEQEFFLREQAQLAPNLRLLAKAEPVELPGGVLVLPCPLTSRQSNEDATSWLRSSDLPARLPDDRIRVLLAHGSVQGFSLPADDEDGSPAQPDLLDLGRLAALAPDYIALGDWHGTKQVGGAAWYSGTPERERFPKGDNAPGHILLVDIPARGAQPIVTPIRTSRFNWLELPFRLEGDDSLGGLEAALERLLGTRVEEDLLLLELEGSVGFEGLARLERLRESLDARLLRLKLRDRVQPVPTGAELAGLTGRGGDPLVSGVAGLLLAEAQAGGEAAPAAWRALRELFALVRAEERGLA